MYKKLQENQFYLELMWLELVGTGLLSEAGHIEADARQTLFVSIGHNRCNQSVLGRHGHAHIDVVVSAQYCLFTMIHVFALLI